MIEGGPMTEKGTSTFAPLAFEQWMQTQEGQRARDHVRKGDAERALRMAFNAGVRG